MIRIIIVACALTLLVSCENEVRKKTVSDDIKLGIVNELAWLEGTWTNINDESQSYEHWTRINDSTLTAFSYVLVENDTVFAEVVHLQKRLNEVFFTVKVPDQNDAEAVTFKLIPSEKGTFTFENKTHDFPKRITYTNPVKDSIHAWIEGDVEGEYRKVDFLYKRDID